MGLLMFHVHLIIRKGVKGNRERGFQRTGGLPSTSAVIIFPKIHGQTGAVKTGVVKKRLDKFLSPNRRAYLRVGVGGRGGWGTLLRI